MAKKPVFGDGNRMLTEEEADLLRHISHKIPTYGGSKSNLFENSSLVSVKVLINGKECFNDTHIELELKQSIKHPHSFELICDPDEFQENEAYLLENSRLVLGKRISFIFYQYGKVQQMFTGIISKVQTKVVESVRHVILKGSCPSVLMENGPHCESFEEVTFEQLLAGIATKYPQNLVQFKVNPNFKGSIPYLSQYNESDYGFIQRLAKQFGEYFYYNGEQFVFSAWGSKIIEMMEGEDIYDFELGMEMGTQGFSYTAYDPKHGEEIQVDSKSHPVQKSVNPFEQYADNVSEDWFNRVSPQQHFYPSLLPKGKNGMIEAAEREQRRNQGLVRMKARGNNPSLRVGDVAKMFVWMPGHKIFKNGRVPAESYKVIEIVHKFIDGHGYEHHFVGVPKDAIVPLNYNPTAYPKAELQHAKVMDHKDPLKMGRLRVQFPWQKAKNSQTPWIQVIQSHAGSGKGTYFTPEIGETVLVAFQGGNPDAPVVLGTAYNGGEIARYYTEGNDIKVIETRSGTRIVFNDAEGKGSILVEDPSGNRVFLDGKGNIKSVAPETIFMEAKNIVLSASQNISISAGENISTLAAEDYNLAAGNIYESAGETRESTALNFSETSKKSAYTSKEDVIHLESGTLVKSNSANQTSLH